MVGKRNDTVGAGLALPKGSKVLEEEGVVIGTKDSRALVKTQRSSACTGCVALEVCHRGEGEEMVIETLNPIGARIGERVKVAIESGIFLKASFLVYIIPIISLSLGALAGKGLSYYFRGDNPTLWAMIGGFSALIGVFIVIFRYNNKIQGDFRYKPKIIEIIIPANERIKAVDKKG